jgi:hypothetical protein
MYCTAAVLLVPCVALAGAPEERHRVLPCRPTVSCTADLVPPGSLEVEAGYSARRAPPGGFVHAEPLLLKLSVLTWFQLQLGMNGEVFTTGEVARSQRYLDDISFGSKVKFVDQSSGWPSIAASAAVQIPSWDRPRNLPYALDASFWLYASKDDGPFHVDLNGGFNVWQFDVAPDSQAFVTLATSLAVTRRWGVLLEVYEMGDGGVVAPRDAGVLSGITFAPVPWLMFDAGGDYGLVRTTRAFTMFAGLTTVVWDFWDTHLEDKR